MYDDPAIAIAWLLAHGAERVAYVDVDVHHGDGPQWIFYGEPAGPHRLPPPGRPDAVPRNRVGGRGRVRRRRGHQGERPPPPFTGDDGWLRAFKEIVPPLVESFRPEILVTQLGCDSHFTDPLANMALTTAAYRETADVLHDLAHRAAGGKWLATGGGGYQWAAVVPRAWTTYFAEMAGAELPDELPAQWVERAEREAGHRLPRSISEPAPTGSGDADAVAASIQAVRSRIFPAHGLS